MAASITLFPTSRSADFVLRNDDGTQHRAQLDWNTRLGTIGHNDTTLAFSFGNTDDYITARLGERKLTLKLQTKGHYFAFLNPLPESEPVALSVIRKQLAADKRK